MRKLPSVLVLFVCLPVLAASSELDRLAKDLKSRNDETRMQAVESLGKLNTTAAVELIVPMLSDREARVRSAAASALWESSEVAKGAIPALRKALADSDPYVVASAAGALIAMDVPKKEVADPLRSVLQRGDPYDRFLAARLLTGVEPAGNLVAPIIDYLRRYVADERDVFQRSDNLERGTKALTQLAKTKDRSQIDPLMTELRGAPAAIIPPILVALGELTPPPDHWVDTLIAQLGSPTPPVRATAVDLLGKQKAAADVRKWAPAVGRLAKDSDAGVRGSVINALGEGKGLAHEALGAVLEMIRSEPDDRRRARAAALAGDIGDAKYPIDPAIKASMGKEALPVLVAAIQKDPNADVRKSALQSLNQLQLDPSEVVPVIARVAVEEKQAGFRTDALILLGNRGHDAESARAMIEPLTRDPDPDVARIAKATLDDMKPSTTASQKPTKPAPAPADPAARERGLAYLREKDVQFADWDFARALGRLSEKVVTAFLDAGMSPDQRFTYGGLPLQLVLDSDYGCGAEMKSLVKLLLDRGADPNGSDDAGNTILMTAAKKCDGEMIRMLIKAGAKVNAKNATGSTAIESAIPTANASAATALVAAGARLTAEQAKMYREVYKKEPKVLELITMATKK